MRSPLGEILLRERLITPEQLQQALEERHRSGYRIGSSLMLLGILDHDTLARVLSLQFGVPAALKRDFDQLSPAVFERIPRKLAEKYLAVPLTLSHTQGRLLTIAIADPTRIAAVDELAFAAGMRIAINVAPEVRLIETLQARYGLIEDAAGFARWAPRGEAPLIHTLTPPASLPPPPSALWLSDEPEEALPPQEEIPPAPLDAPQSAEALLDAWQMLVDPLGHQLRDAMPHPAPVLPLEPLSAEFLLQEVVGVASPRPLSATEAMGRIGHATSNDQVGAALLDYLRGGFSAGVVFVVRDAHAQAQWGFAPSALAQSTFARLNLPLTSASCLRTAYSDRRPYVGPPPRDGAIVHSALWSALRAESAPREVLVVPLLAQTRVVGLVYAHPHGGAAVPAGRSEEIARLCGAASTALLRLASTK